MSLSSSQVLRSVADLYAAIRDVNPLVVQLTNFVVANDQANLTLALGASPIMSFSPEEQLDLGRITGALLVNIGTVSDIQSKTALLAGKAVNERHRPVILDPVGVGASSYRHQVVQELLAEWRPSIITGNAAEIAHIYGLTGLGRGVDSQQEHSDPARLVRDLALRERCVVVLHGATDWLSDGETVVKLSNGHVRLTTITGTGCSTGSAIAAFSAVATPPEAKEINLHDLLVASIAGVLATSIAGEIAAENSPNSGPASFRVAWIDAVSTLNPEIISERARIQVVSVV
ncbi:Hydroxyethylthiazole kinase [Roridomyces roridus]|uniref:hydroxyethylthiazole kinase n=1 Tax=Roridomyces roridus TaxID=1738132 RepID=A0AAD7FHM4_9AGAR|nr:Hydroxyethylthiazole kinase [Roridomyces roridus]